MIEGPLPARRDMFMNAHPDRGAADGDNSGSADVVDMALRSAPWGTGSLAVRFGSATVHVEGMSASQVREAGLRFGALATTFAPDASSATSARVLLVRAPRGSFRVIDTRGWVNTMALEHHEDRVVVVGRDFVARVPVGADRAAAVLATWHEGDELIAPLENTLRIVAAYRALLRGGALLHCVGLVDDVGGGVAGARVCFGPSGIGKSTVAQGWLERGRAILSDELCAVEREGRDGVAAIGPDPFVVEQLPFAGDVAAKRLTDARLPLVGLHRLAQGPASDVDDVSKRDAVRALLGCAPFVNVDRYRLPQVLANLEALASAQPVTRLTLTLGADPRAVLAVHGAVRFALKGDVRYRVVDDEAVIVLQGSAEVMGLNGTGSHAFDLAAKGDAFGTIVAKLHDVLDVEAAVLERDLRAFFVQLAGDGLFELIPPQRSRPAAVGA